MDAFVRRIVGPVFRCDISYRSLGDVMTDLNALIERPDDGWPFNKEAFLFVVNLCLASISIVAGAYWLLPIFIGMALACGIAQICSAIALSARTRTATGKSGAEDDSIQKAGIDAEQSVTKPSPASGGEA